MSNAIDFLEKLGRDAQLRHASNPELAQALLSDGIEPQFHDAILSKDLQKIEALLGGSTNVCCVLGAVEESGDEGPGPGLVQSQSSGSRIGN